MSNIESGPAKTFDLADTPEVRACPGISNVTPNERFFQESLSRLVVPKSHGPGKAPTPAMKLIEDMEHTLKVLGEYQLGREGMRDVVHSLRKTGSLRYFGLGSSYFPGEMLADEFRDRDLSVQVGVFNGRDGLRPIERKGHTHLLVTNSGRTKELLEIASLWGEQQKLSWWKRPSGVRKSDFTVLTTNPDNPVPTKVKELGGQAMSLAQPFESRVQATYSVVDTMLALAEIVATYGGNSAEFRRAVISTHLAANRVWDQRIGPEVIEPLAKSDTLIFAGPKIVHEMALKSNELFAGFKTGIAMPGESLAHGPVESLRKGQTVVLVDPRPEFLADLEKNKLFKTEARVVAMSSRGQLADLGGNPIPTMKIERPSVDGGYQSKLLDGVVALVGAWNVLARTAYLLHSGSTSETRHAEKANV